MELAGVASLLPLPNSAIQEFLVVSILILLRLVPVPHIVQVVQNSPLCIQLTILRLLQYQLDQLLPLELCQLPRYGLGVVDFIQLCLGLLLLGRVGGNFGVLGGAFKFEGF